MSWKECDYCWKPATHVVVYHASTAHGQWDRLPTIQMCDTCTDVAKQIRMLIEEKDLISIDKLLKR